MHFGPWHFTGTALQASNLEKLARRWRWTHSEAVWCTSCASESIWFPLQACLNKLDISSLPHYFYTDRPVSRFATSLSPWCIVLKIPAFPSFQVSQAMFLRLYAHLFKDGLYSYKTLHTWKLSFQIIFTCYAGSFPLLHVGRRPYRGHSCPKDHYAIYPKWTGQIISKWKMGETACTETETVMGIMFPVL